MHNFLFYKIKILRQINPIYFQPWLIDALYLAIYVCFVCK
jgi:hypothetical protein